MFGIWCVVWSKMFGRLKLYWNAQIFTCCFKQEIEETKDVQKWSHFSILFQAGNWRDVWSKLRFPYVVSGRKVRRWKMYKNAQIFACCFRQEIKEVEDVQKIFWFFTCCSRKELRRWKTYWNALIFACCFRREIEEMKNVQKCSDFCMLF